MANPIGLRVCSAIVGAAIAVPFVLASLRVFGGPDVAMGTVSALAFVATFLGALAGLVGAQRMVDVPKAYTAGLADVVYALTFMAVPFLLYVVGAAVFLAAFSSYQF